MSHVEIKSVLLVDARSKNLNAANALVVARDELSFGVDFHMRKFFNPLTENTIPLLSKLLNMIPPDLTNVTVSSTAYILFPTRLSSAIQTPWWSIWEECRGKPFAVHRREFSTDDPDQNLLISFLRELLDDHSRHASCFQWTKLTISRDHFSHHVTQHALAESLRSLKESQTSEHIQ
jgi:hypothetical protein